MLPNKAKAKPFNIKCPNPPCKNILVNNIQGLDNISLDFNKNKSVITATMILIVLTLLRHNLSQRLAGFIFGFPLGAFFYLYGSAWGSRRVEAVQYIGEMSLMGLAGGVLLGGVGLVFVAPVGSVMATYANVERLRTEQE